MKYLPLLLISLVILIILVSVLAIVFLRSKPSLLVNPTSKSFRYEVQQPFGAGYYTVSITKEGGQNVAHVAVKISNLRVKEDKIYADLQLTGEKKYSIILLYPYTPKSFLLYDKEKELTFFPDNENVLVLEDKQSALFTLDRIKDKVIVVFLPLNENLYKDYKVAANIKCNKKFAEMLENNKFSTLECDLYTDQITAHDL